MINLTTDHDGFYNLFRSEMIKGEQIIEWTIIVGGGYGAFLFKGTEEEAEERRKWKAKSEHSVALKRESDDNEAELQQANNCWNHPNFKHIHKGFKYSCECCT